MKCDCIKNLEETLKERGYNDANAENVGFSFPSMEANLSIPFSYVKKRKDGTPQKKRETLNVLATYCPFCGKPMKDEDNDPA